MGNSARLAHGPELCAAIEDAIRDWSVDEFVGRLDAHQVPCGRVHSIVDALADPQVTAREMFVRMPHPTLGEVPNIGNPMKLSATKATYRRPAPALGEHTTEVLRELGYADAALTHLSRPTLAPVE